MHALYDAVHHDNIIPISLLLLELPDPLGPGGGGAVVGGISMHNTKGQKI